jgi:hypothetical protein
MDFACDRGRYELSVEWGFWITPGDQAERFLFKLSYFPPLSGFHHHQLLLTPRANTDPYTPL